MTPAEFIAYVKDAAVAASAKSGLPAGVSIAQAAVESAWGSRAPGLNYFGLTCKGDAPDIALHTHEELTDAQLAEELSSGRILKVLDTGTGIPGSARKRYEVLRNFGAWTSIAKNFEFRDHVICTEPRYADACEAWFDAHDAPAHIRAFASKWATAKSYADTILAVYKIHDLAQFNQAAKAVGA
jgi:flagellum-specific peptidoglycan hydrolase FlgJ